MRATAHQFEVLRDEAWRSEHADAMECRASEDLISRIRALWDADRQFFVGLTPGSPDRSADRDAAAALRMGEQAMTGAVHRAMRSVAKGYAVDGLDGLIGSLRDVRLLLLRPTARRMAEHDPAGRSPDQIARQLLRRVRFEDGRPVMTEDVAADFPCPFEPEPSV